MKLKNIENIFIECLLKKNQSFYINFRVIVVKFNYGDICIVNYKINIGVN